MPPTFLNGNWDVRQGEPFTVRFAGCYWACNLTLWEGPDERNRKLVQELEQTTQDGDNTKTTSVTVKLDRNLPSGMYYFRVRENGVAAEYSPQFILDDPLTSTNSLSSGALAGIIVGAVAGLLIILGGLFLWWRRNKRKQQKPIQESTSTATTYDPDEAQIRIAGLEAEIERMKKVHMLDSHSPSAEVPGSVPPLPVEIDGRAKVPEMPTMEQNSRGDVKREGVSSPGNENPRQSPHHTLDSEN